MQQNTRAQIIYRWHVFLQGVHMGPSCCDTSGKQHSVFVICCTRKCLLRRDYKVSSKSKCLYLALFRLHIVWDKNCPFNPFHNFSWSGWSSWGPKVCIWLENLIPGLECFTCRIADHSPHYPSVYSVDFNIYYVRIYVLDIIIEIHDNESSMYRPDQEIPSYGTRKWVTTITILSLVLILAQTIPVMPAKVPQAVCVYDDFLPECFMLLLFPPCLLLALSTSVTLIAVDEEYV
jgi:hypothetical protein